MHAIFLAVLLLLTGLGPALETPTADAASDNVLLAMPADAPDAVAPDGHVGVIDDTMDSARDRPSAIPGGALELLLASPFANVQSPGLEGLRMLQQQAPNSTNQTILAGNHTGHHTHTHPSGGDQGLGPVWAAPFYGTPRIVRLLDVDGDGTLDAVTGTDIGIVATSGTTGKVLWAHLLGNTITSLFTLDVDNDGTPEIGYSTLWQAQLPRVGVLRADGTEHWKQLGESAFLGAGATDDGDLLAIDLAGYHRRYSGTTGEYLWTTDVEPIRDPTVELVHQNLGHYLAAFGDLNGDGVADVVSAGLYHYGAPFAVDDVYTIIHAVDGATGDKLWIHPIGIEPPVLGYATHVLTDLHVLDARGDGSMDVAYTGTSWRWPLFWTLLVPFAGLAALAFQHYETYARAVDGSSEDLADPLGGRTFIAPVLPLEMYTHLDHVDIDGDSKDELAVIRSSVADNLLNAASSQLEFYRLLPSETKAPTDFVLSPTSYYFNASAALHGGSSEDGRVLVASVPGLRQGTLHVIGSDMSRLAEVQTRNVPLVAAVEGGTVVSGQSGRVDMMDLQGSAMATAPLRARPMDFGVADDDGDGYADVFVLTSDGIIHILDGVTGNFLRAIDLELPIQRMWVRDANGDGTADLYVLRQGGVQSARSLELWDGATLARRWVVPVSFAEPIWFDGNGDGILDLVAYFDSFSDTLHAIDGSSGATLWTQVVPFTFSVQGGFMTDHTPGPAHDIVLYDTFDGIFAFDGIDGTQMWAIEDSFISGGVCGGPVPSGTFLMFRMGSTLQQIIVDDEGSRTPLEVLPANAYPMHCYAHPAEDGLLLDLAASVLGSTPVAGLVRIDDGVAWSTLGDAFISQFGVQTVLGVDGAGDRVVYGREDHVFSVSWSDGSVAGEFVVNGPFVQGGVLVDIDGDAPLEAIAYTGDGIAWLLSEDAKNLTDALDEAAVLQGKKLLGDEDVKVDAKKDSPGLPLLALLALLAAVARRRADKR